MALTRAQRRIWLLASRSSLLHVYSAVVGFRRSPEEASQLRSAARSPVGLTRQTVHDDEIGCHTSECRRVFRPRFRRAFTHPDTPYRRRSARCELVSCVPDTGGPRKQSRGLPGSTSTGWVRKGHCPDHRDGLPCRNHRRSAWIQPSLRGPEQDPLLRLVYGKAYVRFRERRGLVSHSWRPLACRFLRRESLVRRSTGRGTSTLPAHQNGTPLRR